MQPTQKKDRRIISGSCGARLLIKIKRHVSAAIGGYRQLGAMPDT